MQIFMSQEGQFIFNSFFRLTGVLVAFMAAGFCMLEYGLVTTKSVSTIAAKNDKIAFSIFLSRL